MSNAASTFWSNHKGYAATWYEFCAPYIWERISGDAKLAPTGWGLVEAGWPQHVLEIGCLDGKSIAAWVKAGRVKRGAGVDIAEGAIARGRELYPFLDLEVMDLNHPTLPESTYDGILSQGVLHHIENIETCVRALHAALKPGGCLISGDFTGPRRYAYSESEIALIHQGQAMLPEELRGEWFHPDQLATKLQNDPSESISTTVIVPTLRSVFDKVTERRYGGNVLMRALTKMFFRNFDPNNATHVTAVQRMQDFDREVSQEYSHHTYCVSRKAA
jgi:SAM-dependent methyltransferase